MTRKPIRFAQLTSKELIDLAIEKAVEENESYAAGPRAVVIHAQDSLIENKGSPPKRMLKDRDWYAEGPKRKGRPKGARQVKGTKEIEARWMQIERLVRDGMKSSHAIRSIAVDACEREHFRKRAKRRGLART